MDKKNNQAFSWSSLGDVKEGRENLGENMPVFFYRLLEYKLLDVLSKEYGPSKANELFYKAGHNAGMAFVKNFIDCEQDFSGFVAQLGKLLRDNLLGILDVEEFHRENLTFIFTISEDLDCSGRKPTDEVVCHYDEGFIAGIMEAYTGEKFDVNEVDCWARGSGICRFRGTPSALKKQKYIR